MANLTVNRSLKDKAFDRIDHALGRPLDPLAETYRQYFATGEGALEGEFRASPHWDEGCKTKSGMIFFHVTTLGRQALAQHLKDIGEPHRAFYVSFGGFTNRVAAVSAGKARYRKWLDISDCYDITFKEFCKAARVWASGDSTEPHQEQREIETNGRQP